MIGKKSIFKIYSIKVETGKEIEIIVQADNLYRICDIIYPMISKPRKPDSSEEEEIKAYKNAKIEYDRKVRARRNKRQAVMNVYKGRQFNSVDIQDSLGQFLSDLEKKNV